MGIIYLFIDIFVIIFVFALIIYVVYKYTDGKEVKADEEDII